MKEKKHSSCSKEKGFCVSLQRITQSDGEPKGLSLFKVMNFENLKIIVLGVIYRKKSRDSGVLLNYCPFCGNDLRPFRDGYVKKIEPKKEGCCAEGAKENL